VATAEPAARSSRSLEREWWVLTAAFLVRPRTLFEALRDDSDEAAAARQEPITALVWVGGIAAVLATGAASRLLDDPPFDALLIAVWAFLAGGIYGIASYWIAGAALHTGQRGAGGSGRYRQARHLLAFASAPLVVWLVCVWPIRLALYGEDLFRTGGSDGHTSRIVFDSIGGVFVIWCLALLVLGLRTVYRWDWRRSAVALSLTIAVLTAFSLAAVIVLRGA
jgi:hypothetical protein